jgi:MFS family permease
MPDAAALAHGDANAVPYPSAAVGWYATVMLAFLYWLSLLDRYIISLLVDPIKRDLGISDVHFGVLHGLAFVLSFTLFGLVFGALADRVNRRWVIYFGVSVWSLATMLCGVAQSFWHLLLARIGVGAGEAALNPCATSMIADLFPRERLTSAMAVYAIGATVGSGTALVVGGAIVDLVAGVGAFTLPIVGEVRPWQIVFFIVGVPGTLLALLIFTVPEPARRGPRQVVPGGSSWAAAYGRLFRFIRSKPRFFFAHYGGFTLASAVITGCAAWYPVHMTRAFEWSAGRIGLVLGLTLMGSGVLGKLICGWAVDAMYRRGYRDAQLRWYAGCLVVATPIGILALTSANPWFFLVAIGTLMVLISGMIACAMAALNLITPNDLRGSGVAIFATVSGLIGGGSGSLVVALASEHLFSGATSIGLGMAALIGVACPLGAGLLLYGLPAMRAAMSEVERVAKA